MQRKRFVIAATAFRVDSPASFHPQLIGVQNPPVFTANSCYELGCTFWLHTLEDWERNNMAVGAKIAKTADRKKVMDTTKSTDCPKCGKPTRIVKRVKDRERNVPGGIYISCSACEFFEKL
jgi:DNA-directed RNA polymerase subunit M/transcription elongation factor TFIIS